MLKGGNKSRRDARHISGRVFLYAWVIMRAIRVLRIVLGWPFKALKPFLSVLLYVHKDRTDHAITCSSS